METMTTGNLYYEALNFYARDGSVIELRFEHRFAGQSRRRMDDWWWRDSGTFKWDGPYSKKFDALMAAAAAHGKSGAEMDWTHEPHKH